MIDLADLRMALTRLVGAAYFLPRVIRGQSTDGGFLTSTDGVAAWDNTNMATQAELDAHASDTTSVHGIADTTAIGETNLAISVPLTIPLPFTLDNRGGPTTLGWLWGGTASVATVTGRFYDSSAGTYASCSTEFQSADDSGATGYTLPTFDTGDALYIGYSQRFSLCLLDLATAGVGDAVAAETAWEYWNGSAWTALLSQRDDSTKLTAAAGNRFNSFMPQQDWATTSIDSQTLYWIRLRATADNVYNTTSPKLDRVLVYPIGHSSAVNVSYPCPVAGTISKAFCAANVASGATTDTKLLLINHSGESFQEIVWSAGDYQDAVTGLSLAVSKGDYLTLQCVQEHGTTEFANGSITLQIDL